MDKTFHAILRTICYSDIFDYPLTQSELYTYLIWQHKTISPKKFELIPILFELVKSQTICQTNGYFHLPGRENLVNLRKNRQQWSQQKITIAQNIATKLGNDKNIMGIFLTGNLAMNNADQADDIDLLIITKLFQLWTTRLKTLIKLQRLGIRRKPKSHSNQDLICTNMWLDESALAVPEDKQNLYAAHEVAQVKPLVNHNHIYEQFLAANQWIKSYLPNAINHTLIRSFAQTLDEPTHSSFLIPHPSLFESLAYKLQLAYMKPKITRETITPHAAFFHPRDTKNLVLSKYETKLKHALASFRT